MSAPKAVLVGIHTRGQSPESLDHSLHELARLCETLEIEVVGRVTQRLDTTNKRKVLGDGRLEELAQWTGGPGFIYRGPQLTRRQYAERFGADAQYPGDLAESEDGHRANMVVV